MEENGLKIIQDGLSALHSLNEVCHAVSTPKRFREWAGEKGITHIERDLKPEDTLYRGDKKFELVEVRKRKGYGAYHVSSDIQRILEEGFEPLIIDCPRNRRFIFKEVKE